MSQVDTVTQRNASSAEELSSTAEELAAQSEQLQQLMTFFRLAGESSAHPSFAGKSRSGLSHAVLSRIPSAELGYARPADGNGNNNDNEEHNFAPFK
jgi:methyl-accepting chemotaxis protein